MKKINGPLVLFFIYFIIASTGCETKEPKTLTLQPDSAAGKDAYLRSLSPGTNYGNHPDFNSETVTNSGNFVIVRSIIDFDLSSIPSSAVITEAKLYLYTYSSPATGQHLGENLSYLQRITSSWDEMSVTWNNAPGTSILHQVSLPASTNVDENYIVDVKDLVQDYVADKENSFGFMLRLDNETPYARLIFASSDNTNIGLHPKLTITYQ